MPPTDDQEPSRLQVIAAQLDAIFDSAPFGIGLFDLRVRHVRVNPLLAEMNGLPPEELLGRTPAQLHPRVGAEAEELYREVMHSGRPQRDVELSGEVRSRPGDLRHWRASFFPVRHAGEVIGLCVLVADVTAEHELGSALAASEERHRRLAEDLQSSLLPPALPRPGGSDLAALHRTSSSVATVGGDFYDVVEFDDASLLLVVGDVEGTGPAAAALTAAARYAVRAAAVSTRDPAEVLRTVNEVLLRRGAPNGSCTVACVLAEPDGGRVGLRSASAGHPLPLLVHRDGRPVEELGRPGPLLGLLRPIDLPVTRARLDEGDAVVLYTDGATEARYRDPDGDLVFFGEDRLRSVLAAARGSDAAGVVRQVESAVLDFQSGHLADDLAVLALRAASGT